MESSRDCGLGLFAFAVGIVMGSNGLPPEQKPKIATSPPVPIPAQNRKAIEAQRRQRDRAMSALVTLAMLGMAVDSSHKQADDGEE